MPFAHGASAPRYHFAEPMALADIRNFLAIDERLGTAGQPTEAQLGDVAADGYVAVRSTACPTKRRPSRRSASGTGISR